MILIITYDLKARRDYSPFFTAIQQQGDWWHYLGSTWLVNTVASPQQVAATIRAFMDEKDFLLVAELGAHFHGWLPKEAWDWINARVAQQYLPFTGSVSPFAAPGLPSLRK
jgi:hypothetical protein